MIWYVAVGGALGSMARYLMGITIQSRSTLAFPLATLLVNLTGSLLFGFLARYALATPAITPEIRALLLVGFCGGYTTFSSFGYETIALMETGDWPKAALYVGLSVGGSLIGIMLGLAGARLTLDLPQIG